MADSIESFITYWREFSGTKKPYVHPEDARFVTSADFAIDLLPIPINGNLKAAEVLILMLNPGQLFPFYPEAL